ncbi:MAG: nucleotidyltransferase family protein [Gemmatimonadota bacterium]
MSGGSQSTSDSDSPDSSGRRHAEAGGRAVAGIVPAAGLSTRMGSSKPLLDAGGLAFVERVVAALDGGGCAPVLVVVRNPGSPEAALAREAGARVVVNPDPSDGPISSLRAALRSLGVPRDEEGIGHEEGARAEQATRVGGERIAGCVFCPVDHPRVDAKTVARLLDAFRRSDAPITVPVYESRRGHPVIFREALFLELLEEELSEGARTVIRRHDDRVLEVNVDDVGVLVDIDTPGEYREHYPGDYRERFEDG